MKIQQGDVLLTSISKEKWNKCVTDSHNKETTGTYNLGSKSIATVALGEATGHHHSITNGKGSAQTFFVGYRSTWNDDNPLRSNYLSVRDTNDGIKSNDVIMTHQEHNPVTIPPGYYKVDIVREFDHMGQHTRMVVD